MNKESASAGGRDISVDRMHFTLIEREPSWRSAFHQTEAALSVSRQLYAIFQKAAASSPTTEGTACMHSMPDNR